MIKVIASDMDGTLLGDDHTVAPETLKAVKEAQAAGIRFMVATGRNFTGAMNELKDLDLECDYIVGSGAEIRNSKKEIVKVTPLSYQSCKDVYEAAQEFPVSLIFCTDGPDYRIGTPEEVEESIYYQIELFHLNMTRDEIKRSRVYRQVKKNSIAIPDFGEIEKKRLTVYKIFIYTEDLEMLGRLKKKLEKNTELAVSSSFISNLEITDVKAQKGPMLKSYIESLGYKMEEVMALGDSLNDLSMLSMDFGATVAMENGDEEVKKAAKYITKSNTESGVAYTIRELLKRQGGKADGENIRNL